MKDREYAEQNFLIPINRMPEVFGHQEVHRTRTYCKKSEPENPSSWHEIEMADCWIARDLATQEKSWISKSVTRKETSKKCYSCSTAVCVKLTEPLPQHLEDAAGTASHLRLVAAVLGGMTLVSGIFFWVVVP